MYLLGMGKESLRLPDMALKIIQIYNQNINSKIFKILILLKYICVNYGNP